MAEKKQESECNFLLNCQIKECSIEIYTKSSINSLFVSVIPVKYPTNTGQIVSPRCNQSVALISVTQNSDLSF